MRPWGCHSCGLSDREQVYGMLVSYTLFRPAFARRTHSGSTPTVPDGVWDGNGARADAERSSPIVFRTAAAPKRVENACPIGQRGAAGKPPLILLSSLRHLVPRISHGANRLPARNVALRQTGRAAAAVKAAASQRRPKGARCAERRAPFDGAGRNCKAGKRARTRNVFRSKMTAAYSRRRTWRLLYGHPHRTYRTIVRSEMTQR